jgi:hypothetical protein
MKWVIVLVIMENALPNNIREKDFIHFELTKKSLREEQLEHDDMSLFICIKKKVMIPITMKIIEVWDYIEYL